MKTGDKLIATDPCVMEYINRATLTVGKEYEVIGIRPDSFCIFDDDEDLHEFDLGDQKFFKQKKDENIRLTARAQGACGTQEKRAY